MSILFILGVAAANGPVRTDNHTCHNSTLQGLDVSLLKCAGLCIQNGSKYMEYLGEEGLSECRCMSNCTQSDKRPDVYKLLDDGRRVLQKFPTVCTDAQSVPVDSPVSLTQCEIAAEKVKQHDFIYLNGSSCYVSAHCQEYFTLYILDKALTANDTCSSLYDAVRCPQGLRCTNNDTVCNDHASFSANCTCNDRVLADDRCASEEAARRCPTGLQCVYSGKVCGTDDVDFSDACTCGYEIHDKKGVPVGFIVGICLVAVALGVMCYIVLKNRKTEPAEETLITPAV